MGSQDPSPSGFEVFVFGIFCTLVSSPVLPNPLWLGAVLGAALIPTSPLGYPPVGIFPSQSRELSGSLRLSWNLRLDGTTREAPPVSSQ